VISNLNVDESLLIRIKVTPAACPVGGIKTSTTYGNSDPGDNSRGELDTSSKKNRVKWDNENTFMNYSHADSIVLSLVGQDDGVVFLTVSALPSDGNEKIQYARRLVIKWRDIDVEDSPTYISILLNGCPIGFRTQVTTTSG